MVVKGSYLNTMISLLDTYLVIKINFIIVNKIVKKLSSLNLDNANIDMSIY